MECSQQDVLALLATDIHQAFPLLVECYGHCLYTFAYRLVGSQTDAEDIVQEAFVRAYIALVTYPQERLQALKLQPWLYKVTLNEFHRHTRRTHFHIVSMDPSEESQVLEIEDTTVTSPEIHVEQQEQAQELERQIIGLPERYRVPMLCFYFEHLSYQDIADLLNQPLGTVKSHISRGLRLLRAQMTVQLPAGKEDKTWNSSIPKSRKA